MNRFSPVFNENPFSDCFSGIGAAFTNCFRGRVQRTSTADKSFQVDEFTRTHLHELHSLKTRNSSTSSESSLPQPIIASLTEPPSPAKTNQRVQFVCLEILSDEEERDNLPQLRLF